MTPKEYDDQHTIPLIKVQDLRFAQQEGRESGDHTLLIGTSVWTETGPTMRGPRRVGRGCGRQGLLCRVARANATDNLRSCPCGSGVATGRPTVARALGFVGCDRAASRTFRVHRRGRMSAPVLHAGDVNCVWRSDG